MIMDTKLTLKLNRQVILKAKKYAAQQNISLSRFIEAYLQAVTSEIESDEFEISPFVRSIATGVEIPLDIDPKKEYSDYLMEKHK